MSGIQEPTLRHVWLWLGGGALVVCLAILFWFDPAVYHFYPTCIFHQVTGLLCPGCGSLRAVHQLLHGHLGNAFRLNPLLVVALPVLGAFGAWFCFSDQRLRTVSWRLAYPLWIIGVLCLVFTVWRNLPG